MFYFGHFSYILVMMLHDYINFRWVGRDGIGIFVFGYIYICKIPMGASIYV